MANRLQFKRGNGTPGAILRPGEPAFDKQNGLLYVGKEGGGDDNNTGELIGGRSYVDRVDSIIVNNTDINVGGLATIVNLNVTGIATFAELNIDGGSITGITTLSLVDLDASGSISAASSITAADGFFTTLDVSGTSALDGAVTFGDSIGFEGSDVSIVGFSSDITLGGGSASNELVPTQRAVREAINAVVLGEVGSITLDIEGDTGSGSVGLGSTSSEPLVIAGGDNIITTGAGNTITIALSNDVNVGGALTVGGDVDITGGIQVGGAVTFSGDINVGAGASLTVEDLVVTGETELQGQVEVGGDLNVAGVSTLGGDVVVNGNLTVTGTATTVSFEVRDVQVEDRILELGRIGGDVPAVDTTWETGLALNYRTAGTAKKAGILWQDNAGFNLLADFNEQQQGTNQFDPQVPNDTGAGDTYVLAKAGVAELFIGDVTDLSNQVINDEKDASLNEIFIGGAIDSADNKFVSFDNSRLDGKIVITNSTFDGGTYND